MCFKLEGGGTLFSTQDMQRLKKSSSGTMGSERWVTAVPEKSSESGCGSGTCTCTVKCPKCVCNVRHDK